LTKIFKRYWPYLKEYKFYYFIVLIGILLTVAATAATAQIMKPLMDDMFIARDPDMLLYIPLMLVAIYFAKSLGRYLQSVYMNYIGLSMVTRLREVLLDKILHFDMQLLYANRSGEMISRILCLQHAAGAGSRGIDRGRSGCLCYLPEPRTLILRFGGTSACDLPFGPGR